MHILVSLADSCSSLVQASHGDIHISTSSESTGCRWGHLPKGAASRSASALAGWPLAHHLPKTRHPAQDGGPLISFKVWSPRSHSNSGPSPWQIPHLWLYFHTLTAQPPLTGCENTTKDTERKHRGGSCVTTEKHGSLTHTCRGCSHTGACTLRVQHRGTVPGVSGEPLWMKKPNSSKHDGISARRSMGEKQSELLQVCAKGHLLASDMPTPPETCPHGFLCWLHREVWSSERF